MIDGQQEWYLRELPLRNQVVVDIGANRGNLSQFFWDQGAGTNKVISIEPLPQNYKLIQKKIKKSKAKHWRLETCALADISGDIDFIRTHSKDHGWNSMAAQFAQFSQAAETIRVKSKTLEEIAPDATLIKMDIEGGEYSIIDSCLTKFPNIKHWAIELHMLPDRPLNRVLQQFVDQGFSLVAAGRQTGRGTNQWISIPITANLNWEQIPVANRAADGSVFKMLHIIAKR